MKQEKTAVVEARVDIRDLATCANYFVRERMDPTSKSDLLWKIVRTLAMSIREARSGSTYGVEEAHTYLFNLVGSVNRQGRHGPMNAITLSKAIEAESKVDLGLTEDEIIRAIKEGIKKGGI